MHPDVLSSTIYNVNNVKCENNVKVHEEMNGFVVHIYSGILLSHKNKNEMMPFCSSMDALRDYHTE